MPVKVIKKQVEEAKKAVEPEVQPAPVKVEEVNVEEPQEPKVEAPKDQEQSKEDLLKQLDGGENNGQ